MRHDTASRLRGRVALVTGAGRRLGAATARVLHAAGMNVAVHYHRSAQPARRLVDELNEKRTRSALALRADLHHVTALTPMVEEVVQTWGQLDALVNNASGFYPTPVGSTSEAQWDELLGSNLRGPYFLIQAAAPHLKKSRGVIVNLIDIHVDRPMRDHPAYIAAKAGLAGLTRALALDLAPEVRVNGIAPGAILWPERAPGEAEKKSIIDGIPLTRLGEPEDIAEAIRYLIAAPYVSGQILAVDGGRSL